MALINCPECDARVSDAAPACIKCGYPFARTAEARVNQAPAAPVPRSDGIYVTQHVSKMRGAFGMFRAGYVSGYIRFFKDGLMIHGAAIVMEHPEPAPFPKLYRDSVWASDERALHWSSDAGRVRITSANGFVHYAELDGSRLTWNWVADDNERSLFLFHEFVWPDQ